MLVATSAGYIVVAGMHRICAARRVGWEKVSLLSEPFVVTILDSSLLDYPDLWDLYTQSKNFATSFLDVTALQHIEVLLHGRPTVSEIGAGGGSVSTILSRQNVIKLLRFAIELPATDFVCLW